jgi:hypothetical protein
MRSRQLIALMTFMGACTPGGFLFLLALISDSNVTFDKGVWFLLALAGAFGGYQVGKRA